MSIARVFVPNRGEIALRIVRACRELDLQSVVGTSDVDRDGLAARSADRAVCLGPAPAGESYLRDEIIVAAALGTGCDAIHPGYGFLSESPRLASRARDHGLLFVGPPVEVIELAGDKLKARSAASRAGVPVLPGGEVQGEADAHALARRLGYPVLLKAAAGGGGRGIKLVRGERELSTLLGLARSEAGAAFADDRMYLERYIASARHIEVQIAADEHGAVVHLGERDCSVQRRYQKVIEEAPALALSPALVGRLRSAAVELARSIGYRNLGTVEFVVEQDTEEFFFLEINCRIQVEHPVTEAVTRRDLVALQLHLAGGDPLGFIQQEVSIEGHAIECRLNAEDTTREFQPCPGTVSRFDTPELPGLRVDSHLFAGAVVPPYYDSMLAKLIAHGADREAAIETMGDALAGLEVEGVPTNRDLLMSVVAHPDFRAGAVGTDWLERVLG